MKEIRIMNWMMGVAGGRIRSCFAAFVLLAAALPAEADQSGDFYYSVVGGTEVTINGYAGAGGTLNIPSTIGGLPVTQIGYRAFGNRYELTGALAIPNSVVLIGEEAFLWCTNLTGLVIGSGVQEIADGAFQSCIGLTGGLLIPDSVSRIGARAFLRCYNLTGLVLGSGVKEIGANAFGRCEALSGELAIPAGMTNIGAWAFDQCFNLTGDLVLPESLTTIGDNAFFACRELTGLTIGSAVTSIGHAAFANCFGLEGSVTIPDGVQTIGRSTFQLCTNLFSVTVGSGVTNIGQQAFFANYKLNEIYFKAAAPSLETNAFWVSPMTVYYVAGAPGWGAATFGGRPTAVWNSTALFDAGPGTPSYGIKAYNVGNPYGELPTASRPSYGFGGWRTAADGSGAWVTADSLVPYAVGGFRLFAAWATLSQTVAFDVQGGDAVSPASKTVTFGEAYGALPTAGRTGYTFLGWRLNADGAGDEITDSTLVAALDSHTLYAKWMANTYVVTFDAQSGAPMNPKSVTYDAAYGALPGSCRLGYVFGGWWTGAGGTGAQVIESATVTEPANHTVYAKWTYDPHAAQSAVTGVALSLPLPSTFDPVTMVSVKGLPTGLKYNTATHTVTGVPTKQGAFNVTIASAGVESLSFTFTIDALPTWAFGAFSGYHLASGGISMTVSSQGKVTGKVSFGGTNYTFNAASYMAGGNTATGFLLSSVAKAGKTLLPMELQVTQAAAPAPQTLGVVSGNFENGNSYPVAMFRDVWKDEPATLAPYIGYYTATLPGNAEYGSGYLTLTVDKNGKIKMGGKLADGTPVSLSGTLILTEAKSVIAVISAAPAAYQGGRLFTVAEFIKHSSSKVYLGGVDDMPVVWRNRNPQATGTYGDGFYRTLKLTGGWYDKLGNLYGYYSNQDLFTGTNAGAQVLELTVGTSRYPATYWDLSGVTVAVVTNRSGVMTGLTASKAGTPTDADKNGEWDYSADNVVGLKIGLTRATGIFKGSFKAWFDYTGKHTSRSLSFEGALTPVRENMDDGIAGRGFFLWADKSVTPAYAFKWSYDCKILMANAVP